MQIISNINKKPATDLIKVLASISNKKYKLPEAERTKCKLRYYIYLSIIYLNKNKISDCVECVQKVMENSKDTFDLTCCYNILALCECKCQNHLKAKVFHERALELVLVLNNPVFNSILLYNKIVEALHLESFAEAKASAQEAFEVAEKNKQSKNLIFSKILLLYQELCGKDLNKKEGKAPSTNTLKKKTLEFVFKTQGELKFIKKHSRESSLPRGRQKIEEKEKILDKNETSQIKNDQKIISLGNKFNKKRSKTEHGFKKNQNKANQEIFVKLKREAAAKSIQRAWRKFCVYRRKKVDKMRKEKELEECFSVLRRVLIRVCFGLVRAADEGVKRLVGNVVKVQAQVRKMVLVKKFEDLKGKIGKIQGFWKGRRQRKEFLKVVNGVKRIQAWVRGVKERMMMKRWDKSARTIQKYVKRFLIKMFIEKNQWLRKFIRKFLIFKIKNAGLELKPLTVINEESGSSLNGKFLAPIIKIQSLFRMFPPLVYFKVLKASTLLIQKHVRGHLQRKHLKTQQKSALKIQKFIQKKFHFRYDN